MSPKEILIAARKLIETPEGWTTTVYARDANNQDVCPTDAQACKFCALGALIHVKRRSPGPLNGAVGKAWTKLRDASGGTVVGVNDTQGHAAVLAMYDRAIAACGD